MNERWKPISGWPDYQVSSLGRVKRVTPHPLRGGGVGRILKPGMSGRYPNVTLCRNGKTKTFSIHRLVALAFLGDPPSPDMEVNHIDANTMNPKLKNLEWMTKSQNRRHAVMMGNRDQCGERCPTSRLKNRDILEIRQRYRNGEKQQVIADSYGTGQAHISAIVGRRAWAHI